MTREETFECAKCGKKFHKPQKLQRHARDAHGLAKRPVVVYGVLGFVAIAALAGAYLAISNAGSPKIPDFDLEGQPSMGNDSAPVLFVMFEDPDCPFCRRFHEQTLGALVRDFVDTGKVQMFYKEFSGGNPWTFKGSIAQECAFRHEGNGAFWDITAWFYGNQGSISPSNIRDRVTTYAAEQGWDVERFTQCYDNQETGSEISRDYDTGRKLGARGTPSFFVAQRGGEATFVSGAQPYNVFAQAIRETLDRGAGEGAGETRSVSTSELAG